MAIDVGTLVVRLSADISELKSGLKAAQTEIQKIKDGAAGGGPGTNWGAGFSSALGPLGSLVTGVGAFLGIAFSVYGALNLWSSAVHGFLSLMTSAIGAVDEYRTSIIGTAGMLTSITDTSIQPDLSKAYDEWKTYLEWLYRASLETDRKVAAGGAEIFETAKQLAIRGIVPNNKDQVYVIGVLTDFIGAVTQGMNKRQQIMTEIRQMLEGSMRPSAQLLQQFVAIDPDFRAKFEEARAAAISMKDATPIFTLLGEVMKGMTYTMNDMQNTFDSLYSTAKSGFALLMIETFGQAYQEIVKLGWGLLDIYYKNGQLTEEGKKLSTTLTIAWQQVRGAVVDFVEYIRNNPDVVHTFVRNLVTFLGQAANMAIKLGQAIAWVVEKMGGLSSADLETKYRNMKALQTGQTPEGVELPKPGLGKQILGGLIQGPLAEGEQYVDEQKMEKELKQWDKDLADRTAFIAGRLEAQGGILTTTGNMYASRINESGDAIDKAALQLAVKRGTGELPFSMDHPTPNIMPPKAEKAGPKGHQEGLGQLMKQLNDAIRSGEEAIANKQIATSRAAFKEQSAALDELWKHGEIGAQEYFDTVEKNLRDETAYELELVETKKRAAESTYQSNLLAIDQKQKEKSLTDGEVKILKEIELVKRNTAISKADEDQMKIDIKLREDLIKLREKEYDIALKMAELSQNRTWDLMSMQGPISDMEAKIQKMEDSYWKSVYKDKSTPAPGDVWNVPKFGSQGPYMGQVSGDEEFAKLKEQQWQAKWGRYTKEAADAISSGFTGMVDALITGSGDFKKSAYNIMKSLFNIAMKPGLEQLTEALKKGFDSMFKGLGESAGMAAMGAIALIGMMLLGGGSKKSSFSPSGVQSNVTGHEAVRGVVAGETSIPIAQVGVALAEALVSTNGILNQIEYNTRGLKGLDINLNVSIEGLQNMMEKALSEYFNKMGMTGQ